MLEIMKNGACWRPLDNLADVDVGDLVRNTGGEIWGVIGTTVEGGNVKLYGVPAQCFASKPVKP